MMFFSPEISKMLNFINLLQKMKEQIIFVTNSFVLFF